MNSPWRPTLSSRVFRLLILLFPPAFRRRYGPEMRSAFDRSLRDSGRSGGAGRTGSGMIMDLLATLPREWVDHFSGQALPVSLRRTSTSTHDTSASSSRQGSGLRLDFLRQDLRVGARSFLRQPAFTLVSMAMIALGIGATTTIFSVVDGVLLRELPYPRPEELVYFTHGDHTPPRFRAWRDNAGSFQALAAARSRGFDMVGGGEPERLKGVLVSLEFFPMFGAGTALGRSFVPDDFAGEPGVAVLTHGFWERRFGADPGIVGRTVTLSDGPVLVVGVLQPDFLPPEALLDKATDVWMPLNPQLPEYQDPGDYILTVAGRLKSEVALSVAQARLNALAEVLAEVDPEAHRRGDGTPRPITIAPLAEETVSDVSQSLVLLFGAVLLMLLIACANVANLFLARGTARSRELAVRSALGARPRWLIRQLMTESVLLSVMGGVLGVGLSVAGVRTFHGMMPGDFPLVERIQVDVRVLGFSLAICILTGILFGIAPAWQAWRMDVAKKLKDSSTSAIGGFRRARLRNGLLVGQISMSLVLMVGAGLLFNSFVRLRSASRGFEAEGLAVIPLFLDGEKYSEELRTTLSQQLVQSMTEVPGVQHAGFSVTYPFEYFGGARCCWFNSEFQADGGAGSPEVGAVIHPVSRDYFRVLGGKLRGREFVPGDEDRVVIPVVVSQRMADQLFAGDEALGRGITSGETAFTVIGVVSDLHHWGLTRELGSEMYVPWGAGGARFDDLKLLVRTQGDPAVLAPGLREAIWAVDPGLPVPEVIPMRSRVNRSLAEPRFLSALLILFSTLATLLAAGGIYGSVLYQVRQRNREMGLRLALGAARGQVMGMVVGRGAVLTLSGVILGTVGALALRKVLESSVFGISGTHLPTLVGAGLLVGSVAVAASYTAARRAMVSDLAGVLKDD